MQTLFCIFLFFPDWLIFDFALYLWSIEVSSLIMSWLDVSSHSFVNKKKFEKKVPTSYFFPEWFKNRNKWSHWWRVCSVGNTCDKRKVLWTDSSPLWAFLNDLHVPADVRCRETGNKGNVVASFVRKSLRVRTSSVCRFVSFHGLPCDMTT